MSSHQEPLQPTPFEVAPPQRQASEPPEGGGGTPRWVLPALAALLLVAALVVFWLPRQVGESVQAPPPGGEVRNTGGAASPVAAPVGAKHPSTGSDASPWSEAQAARERKEAQDVLARLLEIQFDLQERGAEQWAAQAYTEATGAAAAGDELYRQREYEQATARYREGLARLEELQNGLPAAVEAQLDTARRALEGMDPDGAANALDLAGRMEPENSALEPLRQRLEALPQVAALLERAATSESAGELDAALAALQEAVALDPGHQGIAGELARLTEARRQRQFSDAMSAGYAALDSGRFDEASASFSRAAALQPGSSEAASALQEVEAARTAHRLERLRAAGAEHERREEWQEAVAAYEEAERIDASVLFAREGLQRARERARIDRELREAIDQPGRFSDVAVARAAESLLRHAQGISPRGPLLAGQTARLRELLDQANTPVDVQLHSDGETDVTVYKVARLGQFQQHSLRLRPGRYVAVGQRRGYRDVRLEFDVGHDGAPDPVTVVCTEPI